MRFQLKAGSYRIDEKYQGVGIGMGKVTPFLVDIREGEIVYLKQTITNSERIPVRNLQKDRDGQKYPLYIREINAEEAQQLLTKVKKTKFQVIDELSAATLIEPFQAPQEAVSIATLSNFTSPDSLDWQTINFGQTTFKIPSNWTNVSDPSFTMGMTFSDRSSGAYAGISAVDASYLTIKDYHSTMLSIYSSAPFDLIQEEYQAETDKSKLIYQMKNEQNTVLVSQVHATVNNQLYTLTASCNADLDFIDSLQLVTESLQKYLSGELINTLPSNFVNANSPLFYDNERENLKSFYSNLYAFETKQEELAQSEPDSGTVSYITEKIKLRKLKDEFPNLKYRRSSLYTLMLNDPSREHNNVIVNTFGNTPIPEKFNDHNVGDYLIPITTSMINPEPFINEYLKQNTVAKKLVAKWFNRDVDGMFNMELVAERGQYDASVLDIAIAEGSARGRTLLADAGEELIQKTFVIVNDYRFTNKEELAQKGKKIMNIANMAGSLVGVDLDNVTSIANTAMTVAGKGYVIKSNTYLYKLVWNQEVASQFYAELWQDDTQVSADRTQNFINSDLFKLQYVGMQSAWSDVQSTIFTNKGEEELIAIATRKATDKAISKLQRVYPEFQTKTPLYTTQPLLSAKIGLKEGLEAKDKFEVLEQIINTDGSTTYQRKAIITVEKNAIWDNRYMANEEAEAQGITDVSDRTYFKGSNLGLYPGMLLRQLN
ncbi:MAG: hypothetical protein AAF789_04750 [Bacteroidota bacterium]